MHELHDAVSIATNGTMGCVQHTVAWVMARMQHVDDGTNQSLVKRAISVASVGLDSALNMSEALVEQVLPPPEEGKGMYCRFIGVKRQMYLILKSSSRLAVQQKR